MWRSILFIPVLQDSFLAKAAQRGADAIVLDLEASIPTDRKDEARSALPAAIELLTGQGQDVLVRVNILWRTALADLEVAAHPGVKAIVLPDCKNVSELIAVDAVLTEIESDRGLKPISLIPLIESAEGVVNAPQIARAASRVIALSFGIEDYVADMDAALDPDILAVTAHGIAHAARAAGKVPIVVPESLANLTDLEAFEAAALRGKGLGSIGGFAVNPAQVDILNRVFSPSDEDLAWANRVVTAADSATANGEGVIRLDNRMIDLPIVQRARKIIQRDNDLRGKSVSQ